MSSLLVTDQADGSEPRQVTDNGAANFCPYFHPDSKRILYSSNAGGRPREFDLWLVGEDGLPRAWRLYVKMLPIPGLEITWEEWQELSTGAKVATRRGGPGGVGSLRIEDVAGAETLGELEAGADPFAAWVAYSQRN